MSNMCCKQTAAVPQYRPQKTKRQSGNESFCSPFPTPQTTSEKDYNGLLPTFVTNGLQYQHDCGTHRTNEMSHMKNKRLVFFLNSQG